MASDSLSLFSTYDDQFVNVSPPATPTVNKEQLKLIFKLATIDDVENKKRHEIKAKIDEIKKLLSRRTDRYKVVHMKINHGVDKSQLASW